MATQEQKIGDLDWQRLERQLDEHGFAIARAVVTSDECEMLAESYSDEGRFRSRVVMAKHGFGRGEYKYFGYPLPDLVAGLREALYPPLARVVNRWNEAMAFETHFRTILQTFWNDVIKRGRRGQLRCC